MSARPGRQLLAAALFAVASTSVSLLAAVPVGAALAIGAGAFAAIVLWRIAMTPLSERLFVASTPPYPPTRLDVAAAAAAGERPRPRGLADWEESVDSAEADPRQLSLLRGKLLRVLEAPLAEQGIHLTGAAADVRTSEARAAEAFLGPRLWQLLRPDRPPARRGDPGLDPATAAELTDLLERLR